MLLRKEKEIKRKVYKRRLPSKTRLTKFFYFLATMTLIASLIFIYFPEKLEHIFRIISAINLGKPQLHKVLIKVNEQEKELNDGDTIEVSSADEMYLISVQTNDLFKRRVKADLVNFQYDIRPGQKIELEKIIEDSLTTSPPGEAKEYQLVFKKEDTVVGSLKIKIKLRDYDWLQQAQRTEKIEEKIKFLQYARTLNPQNSEINIQLAQIYQTLKEFKKAIQEYEEAFKNDPQNKDLLFLLAELYARQKDNEGLIQTYERILKQDPTNAVIHNNLGFAYLEKGEMDKMWWVVRRAGTRLPEIT